MTVRRRKKGIKFRGLQSHGWGSKKKRRGGGSRGGRGKAGLMKHKKSLWIKENPKISGASLHKRVGRRFGFKLPQRVNVLKKVNAIKIRDIDMLTVKLGLNDIDLSKFGYNKVLSGGKLTRPISIKAKSFSKKAKENIEKSGGKIIEG